MKENQQLKVRFFKLNPNAKSPIQAHNTDAGWDVFYCPPLNLLEQEVFVPFGKNVVLGTGIKCEIPKGYYLEVKDRSGMATKQGLKIGAKVIDRFYDGEIKINLHNISGKEPEIIEPFQKIAQLVLLPKPEYIWEESQVDDLNQNSQRGEKGFGSSGRF